MANNYSDEFPLLAAHNLYAADIKGDGNCLFNALSDQIYGDQRDHDKIRARVIEYMRANAAYYKQFIDVHPGGGQRRNPKRKNAGVYSTQATFTPPTQEEIDRVFEAHLGTMARGGTYGDNMEISAFTSAFNVDVKIYQHDFAYMISAPEDGTVHPVAHIAYHTWEHYSSIRNVGGPHTGPPAVQEKPLSAEEEAKNKEAAAKISHVLPWMVNVVHQSLPYIADREIIKKTLEECKGNIDAAVSSLLDAEDRASVSSQNGSSSTERDADSENDELDGPNKKQDRRMSRATRALRKEKAPGTAPEIGITISETETGAESQTAAPRIKLAVRPRRKLIPTSRLKPRKEDEEGWVIVASDNEDDGDGDFDASGDESVSDFSGTSRSQSTGVETLAPKNNIKLVVKAKPEEAEKAAPPKRATAREKAEQKKAAQKAARKESRRVAAQATRTVNTATATPSPSGDLGMGIRTLYI